MKIPPHGLRVLLLYYFHPVVRVHDQTMEACRTPVGCGGCPCLTRPSVDAITASESATIGNSTLTSDNNFGRRDPLFYRGFRVHR